MITISAIVLWVTVAAAGYLLCVMAAMLDTATGKRWGLLVLSVSFVVLAALVAIKGWGRL